MYGLSPLELIAGGLPRKQSHRVEACGELHEDELNTDWQRLQSDQFPFPIEPLKQREDEPSDPFCAELRAFRIYTLRVCFQDGTSQVIDFRPVLHGLLFGPHRSPAVFREVRLNPEARTLVWLNGADFDPATLSKWPGEGPLLAAKVRKWEVPPDPAEVSTR